MNDDPNRPVFLERRTYRRRRMADAASLLPVLGVALTSIPLLWHGTPENPASTTDVMLYLFGVWVLLVVLSAIVSRTLGNVGTQNRDNDQPKGR